MIVHRGRVIFVIVGVIVLAAAGGWIAGSNIRSPAEAAARTAPPVPSPILVPVEKKILTSRITTRGTGRFGSPFVVYLASSDLKSGPGRISRLPGPGTVITRGEVLLVASGRPVFILPGEIPMYRDLGYGKSGSDVLQLEKALKQMGYSPGTVEGVYDEKTSAAVAQWYKSKGWKPFEMGSKQLSAIHTLEQELSVAEKDKMAAEVSILKAQTDVAAGEAAYSIAMKAVQLTETTVKASRAEAEASNIAAESEVKSLEIDGTAERKKLALQKADSTRLSGELKVQAAAIDLERARGDVIVAKARLKAARDSLAASKTEFQIAADHYSRVTLDLKSARLHASAQVPADEVVFASSFPLRIKQLNVTQGDFATGPVMVVTDSKLIIDSSISIDEAKFIKEGMSVKIDETDLGIKTSGTVTRVANTPGTNKVDGYHIYFEVSVYDKTVQLDGISVRLIIPVESTGGAVTAVPVSALSLAMDGTSRIQVKKTNGFEFLPVATGLVADGYAAVTPVRGELLPGDLVVIGYGTSGGSGK